MFYISVRIGEEDSWLSGYCGNIGKYKTVQITSDTVTFIFRCLIYY